MLAGANNLGLGWDLSQADLPAPEGPIIKILSVGKDSSDAMIRFGVWSQKSWKVCETVTEEVYMEA